MAAILVLLGFALYIVILALSRGWALAVMWGWFVVPLGAPPIGIAWAIGLATLLGMFSSRKAHSDGEERTAATMLEPILFTAVALFVAWVAHCWM